MKNSIYLSFLDFPHYGKWKRENNFTYLFGANVKHLMLNSDKYVVINNCIRKLGRKPCANVECWE